MATLGKPEFQTPAALQLPPLRQAFDAIRERFKVLEAAVAKNATTATAVQASSSTDLSRQIAILRADMTALAATLAALESSANDEATPFSPTRATIRAAVAGVEQFAPEAPWRVPLMRLTERVEALEQGTSA